jgi:hypothetical protein
VLREDATDDELPSFGVMDGAQLKCKLCKKVVADIHGLRVHHGKAHAEL